MLGAGRHVFRPVMFLYDIAEMAQDATYYIGSMVEETNINYNLNQFSHMIGAASKFS